MVAEFESDLIRLRTREAMKVAKAKGRLRGRQPKLKPNQAKHLLELHDSGSWRPLTSCGKGVSTTVAADRGRGRSRAQLGIRSIPLAVDLGMARSPTLRRDTPPPARCGVAL